MGIIALDRDDLAGARRALDQACALDPDLFPARYTRGLVHLKSGEHSRAVEDLKAAARLYPLSAFPPYHLGRAFEVLKQTDKARQSYAEAMQKSAAAHFKCKMSLWKSVMI